MNRVLPPFPLQRGLAEQMAVPLPARLGRLDWRRFPGGESRVAIDGALEGADPAIVASLADASAKLIGRSSDRTEAPALP
jgi:ribose-phosphate pyrophosphokinase